MYSLIRVWIGLKLARIADPRQGRRQDDQRDRQPVGAELVLDAEDRDPVDGLDELEADPAGQVADEQEQRDDPGHERERRAPRGRADDAGRMATASAPMSGRKMMIDRIGIAVDVHRQPPASSRYEPAMTISPMAMPSA